MPASNRCSKVGSLSVLAAMAVLVCVGMPANQHVAGQQTGAGAQRDHNEPERTTAPLEDADPTGVQSPAQPHEDGPPARGFVIIPGDTRIATFYTDGEEFKVETETVWRPICNSAPEALDENALIDIINEHSTRFALIDNEPDEDAGPGGIAGGQFDIVFVLDESVPPEAEQAFAEAEAYLESKFNDPIKIKINVDFQVQAPGILGTTSSLYTNTTWSKSRKGLQNGMDSNDLIQDYLPSGSTIPVRYNAEKTTITNENKVYWTLANFRATIGSISGTAGDMVFNPNITWDYDPSDGVDGYSFQDVLIHEVGHVLGFSSGADYRAKDLDALDIFRFQKTGAGKDYNPDTLDEFKVRPRLSDFNKPNDQHIVDIISYEYRMSDGDPYQCSHFREQDDSIGQMDPAIALGETRYPKFFSSADLKMFDAIGYDR